MKIIAIDYGQKHVGVAFSDGSLAEPLYSFHTENLVSELQKIINFYKPELLLLGSPDQKPTSKTLSVFSLMKSTGTKVQIVDELFLVTTPEIAYFINLKKVVKMTNTKSQRL